MRVFCDAPAPAPRPRAPFPRPGLAALAPVAQAERRRRATPRRGGRVAVGARRNRPLQPGPYWAIDAGPVRIIGIDTGLLGAHRRRTGRAGCGRSPRAPARRSWSPARRSTSTASTTRAPSRAAARSTTSSATRTPTTSPRSAATSTTTSAIRCDVRRPHHPVRRLRRRRRVHARHPHHPAASRSPASTEDDFRCYPLRGDSLAFYSRRLRPPAAAAPLLRPHRGRGDSGDRRAAGHPSGARTGRAAVRLTWRIRLVARLLGAARRPDRTPAPAAPGPQGVHAVALAGLGDVQPAVLQELPAPGRVPGGDPAALLRRDRHAQAGTRSAGRGRSGDPVDPAAWHN